MLRYKDERRKKWDGRRAEQVFKILPYIAHRTAQQSHTQIPPSTYIFMNHEIRKKTRWRTCSHNKQRQLRAKMYAYVKVLNNKCWKSHRKNPAKFFKLVIAKCKSVFLNNNFNIRHLASILEICFLFFEKLKKQTPNSQLLTT